ncbi:hypothetical protein DFH06DRAFT_1335356 [Mycena polygramma]|nr:hypothetical protein DFH06DRAFT_1335356 [Mycena polygramma]
MSPVDIESKQIVLMVELLAGECETQIPDSALALTGSRKPSRLHAKIFITPANPSSLSGLYGKDVAVTIFAAGLSFVSLHLEVLDNKGENAEVFSLPDVDTLSAVVDPQTPAWTLSHSRGSPPQTVRTKLLFPHRKYMDGFLFALSYVRFLDSHASCRIPLHETPSSETQVKSLPTKGFFGLQEDRYTQASIHTFPVEVLSNVFLFLPASSNLPSRSESPLLLMQICSLWRDVAMGTSELWQSPTFALGPSFFRRGDGNSCSQISLWLQRAKSSCIALSLAFLNSEYLPIEYLDLRRFDPLAFVGVQTLRLYSPQSQIHRFLGPDALMLPALQTLSLTVPLLSALTSAGYEGTSPEDLHPSRVVDAVSAGCDLRIFGERVTLNSLRLALADERTVKASAQFHPRRNPSTKPVDLFLQPRFFFFLTVERMPAEYTFAHTHYENHRFTCSVSNITYKPPSRL